jgi:hypothetical protein
VRSAQGQRARRLRYRAEFQRTALVRSLQADPVDLQKDKTYDYASRAATSEAGSVRANARSSRLQGYYGTAKGTAN